MTSRKRDDFARVFRPLIEGLVFDMRAGSIVDSSYKPALLALTDLVEVKEAGSNNIRPICTLMSEMV
jgi:hypothetical protein